MESHNKNRLSRPEQARSENRACGLTISVLGGVGLRFAGQDIQLANRKARAVLAYLAMNDGQSELRERLAGLLWSDTTDKNARGSLRQVLSDLREALEPLGCSALISSRETVVLLPGAYDLDIVQIDRELSEGTVPDALLARPRVVETLLVGYEDLSPAFNEWVMAARRNWQERLLRTLEGAYEAEDTPPAQRRRMAEAALLLDPLLESACRVAMRLAAEAGETGPALRAYSDLYHVLDEELGMEPSAATQNLVAGIKQGHFDFAGAREQPTGATLAPRVDPWPVLASPTGEPTVAVLPFRSMGPESVAMYLAEGVVEDTVCRLAKLREPVVISSNTTRQFAGRDVDIREIGRDLGVRYLVSGTVRLAGQQLRLSVELAEAENGAVLWTRAFDTSEPDHFETHDEIATSIAQSLVPRLRDSELRRTQGQPPENMAVYHLMLQARDLGFRLELSPFDEAGTLLRRALDTDPHYAPVHAALADWFSIRLGQGWSPDPKADMEALEAAARQAVDLDSGNGRALALLGHNRTIRLRDYDEALVLLARATDSSPNDAETLMWSSPTFSFVGEPGEAIHRAERAIALSPYDPFLFRYEHFLSIAHYTADDYESAAHWGRRSLQRNPHYTSNLRLTAAALIGLGRDEEAYSLKEKVMELQPDFRVTPFIANQAFRDDRRRERFGKQLVEAGFPI